MDSEKDKLSPPETSPTGVCDDDAQRELSGPDVSSDESDTVDLKVTQMKELRKCATFPGSGEVQGEEGLREELLGEVVSAACIAEQGQGSSADGSAVFGRSISLPSRLNLVSAMRGGRKQNGPNEKLHVKWAPDVYDPLATSMSHTVKSHPQRPKLKKDKYRNNKGKSSRGSHNNEKKNAGRKNSGNILDPRDMSLEAARNGLLKMYAKFNAEVFATHEVKSRTCFLNERLSKIHLSIA